ncbi:MAG TPA: DUF4139 domain-containing protein [Phycisphaerae bacterium]|nr:DUF4139 domain-containing protein [Phycisphaerae bacterium]
MTRWFFFITCVCVFAAPVHSEELKSTRIALFNSGVGFFEAACTVDGDDTAELTFRVDQINDILKSLILRDLDGGTIAAVQYPSRDPIEKSLKSFGVDISGKPTLANLLDQLRGVKVEVLAATPVIGQIFGVEKRKTITAQQTVIERDVLTIMTDTGLRSFELVDVAGVKILDPKVEGELNKALNTLALAHDADKKAVTLNFAGKGKRRVLVSYILETPVWKTSYRLGLTKDKKPFLQGWAMVDNATEQDWENVKLSLISGRPISFSMDLYEPLYIERPEEQLALYGSIRPPEYEESEKDEVYADAHAGRQGGGGGGGGGGLFRSGERQNQQGGLAGGRFVRGTELMSKEDAPGEVGAEEFLANMLRPGQTGVLSVASAQSAGELFEYAIKSPVSLKRQQSAMLPIVTEEIDGNKLSVFNPASHPKHPLNAVKLKNTSKLFLMQGPVTVFDGGVYAGDAKLPDLRADEERLVGYALDLTTVVDMDRASIPEEITQIRILKGTMIIQRKYLDERTYTVRNKGDTAKTVILEQDAGNDWTLVEPKEPYEKAGTLLRFKLDVPPGKSQTLKVRLVNAREEQLVLSNLGGEQIEIYLRMKVISEAMKQALTRIVHLRSALDQTRRQMESLTNDFNTISTEQSRIRENMKVLSQTSDVYRRYEKKFDEQETDIEKLRGDLVKLRDQEQKQLGELEQFLLSLEAQ